MADFDDEPTMKPLFNEFEAYNTDGKSIAWAIREIMKDWLEIQSEGHSTREIEIICIDEITAIMAEIRLKKAIDLRREKNQNLVG